MERSIQQKYENPQIRLQLNGIGVMGGSHNTMTWKSGRSWETYYNTSLTA